MQDLFNNQQLIAVLLACAVIGLMIFSLIKQSCRLARQNQTLLAELIELQHTQTRLLELIIAQKQQDIISADKQSEVSENDDYIDIPNFKAER